MECNFCKNILLTQVSLDRHKKNNKKCLEIQINLNNKVIIDSLVKCDACFKEFSIMNINRHNKTCKERKNKSLLDDNIEQLKLKHNNEIQNLKKNKFMILKII